MSQGLRIVAGMRHLLKQPQRLQMSRKREMLCQVERLRLSLPYLQTPTC
jgi:hypothetical protein